MCLNLVSQWVNTPLILFQPAFTRAMLAYVRTMLKINSTEEEIAIYTGSLLLCPHRAGLSDTERIDSLNRALGDALQQAVSIPYLFYLRG